MAGFFCCKRYHATLRSFPCYGGGSFGPQRIEIPSQHGLHDKTHTQNTQTHTRNILRYPFAPLPSTIPATPSRPALQSAPTAQGVAGSLEWDAGSRAGGDAMSAGYSKGGRFCLTSSKKMTMLDRLCLGLCPFAGTGRSGEPWTAGWWEGLLDGKCRIWIGGWMTWALCC